MAHEIAFNDDESRWELRVDGELASFADYRVLDGRVIMPHTVTALGFRGQGLAAEVVRAALDDARERELQVVPACSFVADFLDTNAEYADLRAS